MHAEAPLERSLRHAPDISGIGRSLQAVDENYLTVRCGPGLMLKHANRGGGIDLIVAQEGRKPDQVNLA